MVNQGVSWSDLLDARRAAEPAAPPPSKPAPAPPPAPPPPPPPPAPRADAIGEEWPQRGGSGGPHRMAGTWPTPPPRELWWPPRGGTSGYHRMAGRRAARPAESLTRSVVVEKPAAELAGVVAPPPGFEWGGTF